jgi:hypothetical protein
MLFDPNQGRHSRVTTVAADDEIAAGVPAMPTETTCGPDAAPAVSALPPSTPRPTGCVRKACAILGKSGLAVAVVGIGLAAASTLWALRLDVPYQVALLAGYISLAATVCLCAALVAVRYYAKAKAALIEARSMPAVQIITVAPAVADAAPPEVIEPVAARPAESEAEPPPAAEIVAPAPAIEIVEPAVEPSPADDPAPVDEVVAADEEADEEPEPPAEIAARPTRRRARLRARHSEPDGFDAGEDPGPVHIGPDYAAWARFDRLRVADAARLWCGLSPGDHVTDEVTKWASAMLEAVTRGELAKCESTGVIAQYKIGWHTEVPREALKTWALAQGQTPRFLDDPATAAQPQA